MGKRFWLCVLSIVVLVGHLVFDANHLYSQALSQQGGHFDLPTRRLSDRVILIVLDSWPERMLADGRHMPKLYARRAQGASGVLWAPKQTATVPGILTLSTGVPPAGLAAIGLMSSARYTGWTIFDDVVARGETVSFHGGPAWVPLFGDRSQTSFRESGHGPKFREEDVEALLHSQAAQLSARPPALSVVHITETDVAGHQYGTEAPEYDQVLRFWDDQLDSYLQQVLKPGTTVIVTADHGCDVVGSHGGPDPIFRRVPLVMMGQGIQAGARVEMSAADMPVTMATLLDTQAPAAAFALPAVEALTLSPAERARATLVSYYHSIMERAHVKAQVGLMAQARSPLPKRLDDLTFAWVSDADAAVYLPAVKKEFAEMEVHVVATRALQVTDWVFVLATFALAWTMAWTLPSQRPSAGVATQQGAWLRWMPLGVFLVLEGLFAARVALLPLLRAELKQAGPSLKVALLGAALLALGIAVFAWRRRDRFRQAFQAWPQMALWLVFVLCTVVLPLTSVGMMACGVVAVIFLNGRPGARAPMLGLLIGLAYLLIGPVLWGRLGESMEARYSVGWPVALLGAVALAWLSRQPVWRSPLAWWLPLLLGLALTIQPMSGLPLPLAGREAPLWLASGLVVALALVAIVLDRRWWGGLWFGAWTLAFWWWGLHHPWGLYLCLAAQAGGLLVFGREASARAGTLGLGLGAMLLTLSAPGHAVSVVAILAVAGGVVRLASGLPWRPGMQLALLAIVLVAARYALFELFGFADSPAQGYSLKHLDLTAAYLGDDTRHILGAAGMVVLKICLASAALLVMPLCVPAWRARAGEVAQLMASLFAIGVGQAAIRSSLAVGGATFQYDFAAFTMLIHTGLLVFTLLVFALLTARMGGWRRAVAV